MRSAILTSSLFLICVAVAPHAVAGAEQTAARTRTARDQRFAAPARHGSSRLPGLETLLRREPSPARPAAPARNSSPTILALPEVQAELALTPGQKATLQEIFDQSRAELRRMRPLMEKAPRTEQEKFQAGFRKQYNDRLLQVLRPEQFQRYHQILFQERGIVAAFGSEEVVKSLGITDQQRAEILELRKQEIQELFQLARGGQAQSTAARVKAMRQQGEAKMLARLTEQQRAEWQKLLGPPFQEAPSAR